MLHICDNIVTAGLYQSCYGYSRQTCRKLPTSLEQLADDLKQAVQIQLVSSLSVKLLQVVRFYACRIFTVLTLCLLVSYNGVAVKNAWRLSSKQNNTSCLFQAKSSEQRDKWIGYFLQERKIVYETTSGRI